MMETFFHTDFSPSTMQFRTQGTSPGGSVVRTTSPQFVFQGEASLQMTTPAGEQYKRASAGKWFPWEKRRLVTDVWFQLPDNNADLIFEVAMEGYDGVKSHLAGVQWVKDSAFNKEQWRKWGPTGGWEDFPGGDITVARGWYQWHHMAFVSDYAAEQYVSLKIDGTDFDLAGLTYESRPDTQGPYLSATFLVWNQSEAAATAGLGKVTLGWQ